MLLFLYHFISSNKSTSFYHKNSILLHLTFWSLAENILPNSMYILLYSWIYILFAFIFYFLIPYTPFKLLQINLSSDLSNHNFPDPKIQYLCFAHPSIQQHCNPVLFIHDIENHKSVSRSPTISVHAHFTLMISTVLLFFNLDFHTISTAYHFPFLCRSTFPTFGDVSQNTLELFHIGFYVFSFQIFTPWLLILSISWLYFLYYRNGGRTH